MKKSTSIALITKTWRYITGVARNNVFLALFQCQLVVQLGARDLFFVTMMAVFVVLHFMCGTVYHKSSLRTHCMPLYIPLLLCPAAKKSKVSETYVVD